MQTDRAAHVATLLLVAACALGGSACGSSKTDADTSAPAFTGCTPPTATGPSSISLTWPAATDNDTAAEKLVYNVYVAKTRDGINFSSPPWTFSSLDGTPVVGGQVTDLRPGTEYFFVCRVRDRWLNEDQNTNVVSVSTQPDPTAGDISFKANVLPLVRDICAGNCHVPGGNQAGGLVLTDSVAYDVLTSRTATQGAKWPLVVKEKPEESFLWVKVCTPDQCPGLAEKAAWTPSDKEDFMPPTTVGYLKPEQQKLFRDWITQGAKNN